MFKKFKDKIAEEMKQSPARLQASMQQLAQAVVSPALSNSSIQDISTSNDNFSLTEEGDATPKNSPAKHGFQNVNLIPPPNSSEMSRRSSVSSITSDTSSLFPIYESPQNLYHLQSDMDQSASEIDENISPQLDRVTKDQLYGAYRKVQGKYHKYRGRYTDLVNHYRELERAKTKLESVLVETQDKVLRRIADLKEQCQLEQQAKAHLEEVLRNDIEEKDHIINTLNTKVRLLQANGPSLENLTASEDLNQKQNSKVDLIDLGNEPSASTNDNSVVIMENEQLKDKLKKLENLVLKYKDSLKRNKGKCTEITEEKNAMEHELHTTREQITSLTEQVNVLKKREEEYVISLAENKLSIHRELEGKEEQIKQLQFDLKQMTENNDKLKESLHKQKIDLEKLDLQPSKAVSHETQERSMQVDDTMVSQNISETESNRVQYSEEEIEDIKAQLKHLEKLSEEYENEKGILQYELSTLKTLYKELRNEKEAQQIIMEEKRKESDMTIDNLQDTIQSLDKELENIRNALMDRDRVCETYNMKIQEYAAKLESSKEKIIAQEVEIRSLKAEDKVIKLQEELEHKNIELLALQSELNSCNLTVSDLKERMMADGINKTHLAADITDYNNRLQKVKQDFSHLRAGVLNDLTDWNNEISVVAAAINSSVIMLGKENEQLRIRQAELEVDLKRSNKQVDEMIEKVKQYDELDFKHNNLITTINGLNLKIHDLEKAQNEVDVMRTDIKRLEEKLETLKNVESKNKDLNAMYEESTRTIELLKSDKSQYNLLQQEIGKLQEQIDHLKEEVLQKDNEIKLLTDSLENEKSQNENLKTELNEHVKQTTELQEAINTRNVQLKKLKSIKERQAKSLQEITEQLNKSNSENIEIVEKLEQSKRELEELHKFKTENTMLLEKLRVLEQELQTVDNLRLENTEILQKLQASEKDAENLSSLKVENAELIEKIKLLQQDVQLFDKLQAEYAELSERLSSANKELQVMHNLKEENSELLNKLGAAGEVVELLNKLKVDHSDTLEKLKESEKEIEVLKDSNSTMASELERLVLVKDETVAENKNLKDKQNELLKFNEELRNAEHALQEKVKLYELQLNDQNTQLMQMKLDIQKIHEEEMQNMKINFSKESETLCEQISSLNESLQKAQDENKLLVDNLNTLSDKHIKLKTDLENTQVINTELKKEQECLEKKFQDRIEGLESQISTLEGFKLAAEGENIKLKSDIECVQKEKDTTIQGLRNELEETKVIVEEKSAELKLLDEKNTDLLQEMEKASALSSQAIEEKNAQFLLEIARLEESKRALEKELENAYKGNQIDEALIKKSSKLQEENKKLEAQLDEALITFQAKESQMQIVNNELRGEADQLKEELKTNEEEQSMRLKQLVKEFQAQLQDKEEELQAALEKRFDRQKNYESDLIHQYKEQLKDFQVELTAKSEQIECLILQNKEVSAQKEKEIDRLIETIAQMKKEHASEVKEIEKKWKAIVQQRTEKMEVKHEEEINELTKEWQNERRPSTENSAIVEELESTSRVAMAAVQSNTGSFHTLQQTLASQRRELTELRKLVKLRHDALEDSTEIEYLRNILFEYMMGRETMVLARVIAAVVKFDQQQTATILKKEEDKLTLLGSLGLT